MCACDGGMEEAQDNGLISGHMYAVLRAEEVDGTQEFCDVFYFIFYRLMASSSSK